MIALYLYADLDQELKPEPKFVVYPGNERYRIKEDVDAISLRELAELLQG